jgi:hypothetical protein
MSRKIIGITVGSSLPKPNFKQTDPTKGDYIKNKPDFEGLKSQVKSVSDALATKQPAGNYLTAETDPTVPAWAKAETKPTYTASEVGAVSYIAQILTEEQKVQARANIGVASTEEMVQQVIAAIGSPIVGIVDENNNIILYGVLSAHDYKLYYEYSNGDRSEIGNFTVGQLPDEPESVITRQVPLMWNTGVKIDKTTGIDSSDENYSASDNITIKDGFTYIVNQESGGYGAVYVCFYDNNNQYLGYQSAWSANESSSATPSCTVDMMDGATTMRFGYYAIGTKYTNMVVLTETNDPNVIGGNEIPDSGEDIPDTGYVNQIPISTDTNGSVFNGTGFRNGYRLNSSGAIAEYTAHPMVVSGFIPCKSGDIIRLQNITWQSGVDSQNNQRIACYDANKNYLNQSNVGVIAGISTTIKDENNIVQQFTLASDGESFNPTNAAFVRISATHIGADSILTVNQEIV